MHIFLPKNIANNNLLRITQQYKIHITLQRLHVLRMERTIPKVALHWTPEGKWKRRMPKITWRRTTENERELHHHQHGEPWREKIRDRQKWRDFLSCIPAGIVGMTDWLPTYLPYTLHTPSEITGWQMVWPTLELATDCRWYWPLEVLRKNAWQKNPSTDV